MKFQPLVEPIIRAIFRCGGKVDLTSKGQNIHWQNQRVVKIVYCNVYDLFLCPKRVSNIRRECFESKT